MENKHPYWLIPVCVCDHWILVIAEHPTNLSTLKLWILDSFNSQYPQQQNGTDCGVFVLLFMLKFVENPDILQVTINFFFV